MREALWDGAASPVGLVDAPLADIQRTLDSHSLVFERCVGDGHWHWRLTVHERRRLSTQPDHGREAAPSA